tara:strand:+ start:687 stop:842 length:156 start_codon:yes stop_codon:yes gene_type:complete
MKNTKTQEVYITANEELEAAIQIFIASILVIILAFIAITIMAWLVINLLGI